MHASHGMQAYMCRACSSVLHLLQISKIQFIYIYICIKIYTNLRCGALYIQACWHVWRDVFIRSCMTNYGMRIALSNLLHCYITMNLIFFFWWIDIFVRFVTFQCICRNTDSLNFWHIYNHKFALIFFSTIAYICLSIIMKYKILWFYENFMIIKFYNHEI